MIKMVYRSNDLLISPNPYAQVARVYGGRKKVRRGGNIFGDITGTLLGGLGQGINRGLSGLFGGSKRRKKPVKRLGGHVKFY